MGVTTISGVVSNLRHSTETYIDKSQYGANVVKTQVITFRVGDRSAQIKLDNMPDIRNGDQVTLAGKENNGMFKALALRNEKTGAIYNTPTLGDYVVGSILIAAGLITLILVFGFIFIAGGLWFLNKAYSCTQAVNMLRR